MGKLFIICGHGAGDPGAIGNGYQEAERVRALANRIKHFGGDSVIIGDTSVKWSRSRYLTHKNVPKGSLVLELHMDSSTSKFAKGGHVIIKSGLGADKYDKALANFISSILPGRSKTIVGRNDLMNPNMAASAGINYRLMECGFISNAGDVGIFNSKMDEIAKGILKCFDIKTTETVVETPKQQVVNNSKLTVDGSWGVATTKATQKVLGTSVDGVVSRQPKSNKKYLPNCSTTSWKFVIIYKGGSALIKAIQRLVGATPDGYCGKQTVIAIQKFLKIGGYYHGIIDGSMGALTVKAWQSYINSRL